ncbi:hypothetical protein E3Q22_00339 [Wallemia mellicola]|uniref:Endonuclease V n=1 Tax=Wallemia mellicola TaxID=1708541 RepID=A0A4T0QFL7_9BASI|nr:hypothetical protein E3Q24_00005 [Wallemia mellicola]TIB82422.1 hypothetical protein E3Q22_00339 [Wallemia mellicola]TIB82934.1 hypothetical protein E3Q21_03163 [Wallemia mellicola]TIB85608.1 hypothetical protein E3Q20_03155 [Wallemia mellicola]TIB98313.1 hypothetical protein E3Q17_03041 [Wallemia mellicola]
MTIVDCWNNYQNDLRNKADFVSYPSDYDITVDKSDNYENDLENPSINYVRDYKVKATRIGGIDVSPGEGKCVVTITVLSYPSLEVIYTYNEVHTIMEPYIPSYLAMRESKPIRETFYNFINTLEVDDIPQVYIVDGNGRLHDREAGLATQIGVELDIATIGASKNYYPLTSLNNWRSDAKSFRSTIKGKLKRRGEWLGLFNIYGKEYVGAALLTGEKANNPIYISAGHKCTLYYAIAMTLSTAKHRVPEPIRIADQAGRQYVEK